MQNGYGPQRRVIEDMPGLLLLLWAIWGMIVDVRYKRRGGARPTRNDRLFALTAIALCAGSVIAFGVYFDSNGEAWAHLTELFGTLLIYVFALWEFGRWRVRRKNPLAKGE